jgi:hypothetical protein
MSCFEVRKGVNLVVAQDINLSSGGLEIFHTFFQLDQLGATWRSPNHRARKDKYSLLAIAIAVQVDVLTIRI